MLAQLLCPHDRRVLLNMEVNDLALCQALAIHIFNHDLELVCAVEYLCQEQCQRTILATNEKFRIQQRTVQADAHSMPWVLQQLSLLRCGIDIYQNFDDLACSAQAFVFSR